MAEIVTYANGERGDEAGGAQPEGGARQVLTTRLGTSRLVSCFINTGFHVSIPVIAHVSETAFHC